MAGPVSGIGLPAGDRDELPIVAGPSVNFSTP